MARIWRDGQRLPCSVYRLITTGTIEEKVYQRQIMKGDLAAATVVAGAGARSALSHASLRELFTLELPGRASAGCSSHQVLEAAGTAGVQWLDLQGACGGAAGSLPPALAAAVSTGVVSAINAESAAGIATADPAPPVNVEDGSGPSSQPDATVDTPDVLDIEDD